MIHMTIFEFSTHTRTHEPEIVHKNRARNISGLFFFLLWAGLVLFVFSTEKRGRIFVLLFDPAACVTRPDPPNSMLG